MADSRMWRLAFLDDGLGPSLWLQVARVCESLDVRPHEASQKSLEVDELGLAALAGAVQARYVAARKAYELNPAIAKVRDLLTARLNESQFVRTPCAQGGMVGEPDERQPHERVGRELQVLARGSNCTSIRQFGDQSLEVRPRFHGHLTDRPLSGGALSEAMGAVR